MTVKQRAWQTFCEPIHGKPVKILVWKNQDYDSCGQEVTLHPKYMKSWNAVLSFLTAVLQPRFGAIRKLYHLDSRKLVLCLQDIKSNGKYVAVGANKFKFKKNGYLTEEDKKLPHSSKCSSGSIHVEDNAMALEDFMAYTKKKHRTVVYFMVSGRACQTPLKVVLIESDFMDYNMILEYLGYRLDVGEGVQSLYDVKGRVISNLNELRHGELYVAVPFTGKFIKLDYARLFEELIKQTSSKVLKVEEPKVTNGKKKAKKSDSGDSPSRKTKGTSFQWADNDGLPYAPDPSCCTAVPCNWGTIQMDFKNKINDIVDDVNAVRSILSDLVNESMSSKVRDNKGNATSEDLVDSVELVKNGNNSNNNNNMTTFADIAKRKNPSEPNRTSPLTELKNVYNPDLLPRNLSSPSVNGIQRKSVSFMKTVTPKTIDENLEKELQVKQDTMQNPNEETSLIFEKQSIQRALTSKGSLENLNMDDQILEEPTKSRHMLNQSLILEAIDEGSENQPQVKLEPSSNSKKEDTLKVDKETTPQSKQSSLTFKGSPSLQDDDENVKTHETDGSQGLQEKDCSAATKSDHILNQSLVFANRQPQLLANNGNNEQTDNARESIGIQKNWKYGENIENKAVQSDLCNAVPEGFDFVLAKDLANFFQESNNALSSTEKADETAKCGEEIPLSFGCSHINLKP